ncbi:MAG: hypothetical protein IPO16_09840 [Saprospiraceae bacterium]|nr:hypothetical protein [Saprospiraceae bacterium]
MNKSISIPTKLYDSAICEIYPEVCIDSVKIIKVGFFLTNLYDINLIDNSFKATFWVWMNYKDSLFRDLIDQDLIDIFDTREIDTRMKYTLAPEGSRQNYWSWILFNVTFVKDWNVINFPFDKHKIKIEFETSNEDSRYLRIIPDSVN